MKRAANNMKNKKPKNPLKLQKKKGKKNEPKLKVIMIRDQKKQGLDSTNDSGILPVIKSLNLSKILSCPILSAFAFFDNNSKKDCILDNFNSSDTESQNSNSESISQKHSSAKDITRLKVQSSSKAHTSENEDLCPNIPIQKEDRSLSFTTSSDNDDDNDTSNGNSGEEFLHSSKDSPEIKKRDDMCKRSETKSSDSKHSPKENDGNFRKGGPIKKPSKNLDVKSKVKKTQSDKKKSRKALSYSEDSGDDNFEEKASTPVPFDQSLKEICQKKKKCQNNPSALPKKGESSQVKIDNEPKSSEHFVNVKIKRTKGSKNSFIENTLKTVKNSSLSSASASCNKNDSMKKGPSSKTVKSNQTNSSKNKMKESNFEYVKQTSKNISTSSDKDNGRKNTEAFKDINASQAESSLDSIKKSSISSSKSIETQQINGPRVTSKEEDTLKTAKPKDSKPKTKTKLAKAIKFKIGSKIDSTKSSGRKKSTDLSHQSSTSPIANQFNNEIVLNDIASKTDDADSKASPKSFVNLRSKPDSKSNPKSKLDSTNAIKSSRVHQSSTKSLKENPNLVSASKKLKMNLNENKDSNSTDYSTNNSPLKVIDQNMSSLAEIDRENYYEGKEETNRKRKDSEIHNDSAKQAKDNTKRRITSKNISIVNQDSLKKKDSIENVRSNKFSSHSKEKFASDFISPITKTDSPLSSDENASKSLSKSKPVRINNQSIALSKLKERNANVDNSPLEEKQGSKKRKRDTGEDIKINSTSLGEQYRKGYKIPKLSKSKTFAPNKYEESGTEMKNVSSSSNILNSDIQSNEILVSHNESSPSSSSLFSASTNFTKNYKIPKLSKRRSQSDSQNSETNTSGEQVNNLTTEKDMTFVLPTTCNTYNSSEAQCKESLLQKSPISFTLKDKQVINNSSKLDIQAHLMEHNSSEINEDSFSRIKESIKTEPLKCNLPIEYPPTNTPNKLSNQPLNDNSSLASTSTTNVSKSTSDEKNLSFSPTLQENNYDSSKAPRVKTKDDYKLLEEGIQNDVTFEDVSVKQEPFFEAKESNFERNGNRGYYYSNSNDDSSKEGYAPFERQIVVNPFGSYAKRIQDNLTKKQPMITNERASKREQSILSTNNYNISNLEREKSDLSVEPYDPFHSAMNKYETEKSMLNEKNLKNNPVGSPFETSSTTNYSDNHQTNTLPEKSFSHHLKSSFADQPRAFPSYSTNSQNGTFCQNSNNSQERTILRASRISTVNQLRAKSSNPHESKGYIAIEFPKEDCPPQNTEPQVNASYNPYVPQLPHPSFNNQPSHQNISHIPNFDNHPPHQNISHIPNFNNHPPHQNISHIPNFNNPSPHQNVSPNSNFNTFPPHQNISHILNFNTFPPHQNVNHISNFNTFPPRQNTSLPNFNNSHPNNPFHNNSKFFLPPIQNNDKSFSSTSNRQPNDGYWSKMNC